MTFTYPIKSKTQAVFRFTGEHQPYLSSDYNGWEKDELLPFQKKAAGEWEIAIEVEADAYIEYTFFVGGKRILDPLNPNVTDNGMGKLNNFFYMPDASRAVEYTQPIPADQAGSVTHYAMETRGLIYGSKRNVSVYTPPSYHPRTPVLVVLDGQDYRERAAIHSIVDALICRQEIPPIILIMVDSLSKARTPEYMCSDGTLYFLNEVVLPQFEKELGLEGAYPLSGRYGILGASLGGLFAVYAGMRFPHIFGKVLSQSGAFSINRHDFIVWEMLKQRRRIEFDLYMDVGKYEYFLGPNKRFYNELQKKASRKLKFKIYNAGHNYPAWQMQLAEGLRFMYGKEFG